MPTEKKKVVFGFLGTFSDRPNRPWRPTLSLFVSKAPPINEFHLFYGRSEKEFKNFAEEIEKEEPFPKPHEITKNART
jgi:hypothetical protein